MSVIERIKAVNAERIDLDGAVELLALGALVSNTFKANHLETPMELQSGVAQLTTLVATKRKESIERQLREARSRRADLSTAEEKRRALDADIVRLEALAAGQASA